MSILREVVVERNPKILQLWIAVILLITLLPIVLLAALKLPFGRYVGPNGTITIQATWLQVSFAFLSGLGCVLLLFVSWWQLRRWSNAIFLVAWSIWTPVSLYVLTGFCLTKVMITATSFTLPANGLALLSSHRAEWDHTVAIMRSTNARGTKNETLIVTVYLDNGQSFSVPFGDHTQLAWRDLLAEAKRRRILVDDWN